jgi:predicted transcriptional regulator
MGLVFRVMNTYPRIYDYVMASLRSKEVPQRQVAQESGVPYSTVTKIAQGAVSDPSVHTVQTLFDYFMSRATPTASSITTCREDMAIPTIIHAPQGGGDAGKPTMPDR